MNLHKHIILIGFKHVGKSAIGRALASELGLEFVDLDEEIARVAASRHGTWRTPGTILREEGEEYFRQVEHEALEAVLRRGLRTIVATGGSTALKTANQELMQPHIVVHVTGAKGGIYERILMNGRPAFFPKETDPYLFFQHLWEERQPVYAALARHTIENTGSIAEATKRMKSLLLASV